MRFFFFGLLRDPDVLKLVLDRLAPGMPFPVGYLPDTRLVQLRNDTFPMVVASPGDNVPGVIVDGLTEADLDRIRFFESVEYEPSIIEVEQSDGGPVAASAFISTGRAVPGEKGWHFEDWATRHKAKDLRQAGLWMSLYGHLDVEEADRRWDEALAAGHDIEDLVREIRGAAAKPGR